MGWGLGKNSPIVLSLGRGNYEAMLLRHGQNIRWRMSRKCTCNTDTNRPDPRCPQCHGSGELYDYQKFYVDTLRVRVDAGIAELPPENMDCEVLRAYDAMGIQYKVIQMGQFLEFESPTRVLENGEVVEIVFKQPITATIEEVKLESLGNGFYRVPGVLSDLSKIEGVDYRAPGDIIDMDAVFDSKAQEVDIVEYRNDTVCLNDNEAKQPITAFGVKYIKPFKFFVLSQNLDEEDTKLIQAHGGDAISTFPYVYNVSEGDVITVLSGANTKKIVLKRRDRDDDILPDYFVSGVSYLATAEREYTEGVDFSIIGANKIFWTCDDPPEPGINMAISYQYLPTYRVHKNVPMLRTSEDQHIPRKVVLKLFSSFQEGRGVNRSTPGGTV
ncbi:hypothetical protein FACS189447_03310 [Spirochaetia bacterium]|nr:hypothetical protein FACS189447_03310 [Spirochaetia bacterium]